MMNKNIVLVRGIPGSGKSTFARRLLCDTRFRNSTIVETDDFFINSNGYYEWNYKWIKYAHEFCFTNMVQALMIENHDTVIIAKTFTRHKEMSRYLEFALNHDINVYIFEPGTSYKFDVDECHNRCIHNVPRETIQKMLDRYESSHLGKLTIDQIKLYLS